MDITNYQIKNEFKNQLDEIRVICIALLLLDQHDIKNQGSYGSWGRSTVDYCLLCTRKYPWDWNKGSITQTSWALQALNKIDLNSLDSSLKRAVINAFDRAGFFIKTSLINKFYTEPDIAQFRHNATCMLAYNFLPKNHKYLPKDEAFQYQNELTNQIQLMIKNFLNEKKEVSTDIAQIASYVLMLASIFDRTESTKIVDSTNDPFYNDHYELSKANKLFEMIGEFINEILNRGVKVGTWGDQRVISPLLQTTMLIHTAISSYHSVNKNLNATGLYNLAKKFSIEYTETLSSLNLLKLPRLTNIGLIDPWSLISFAIASLEFKNQLSQAKIESINKLLEIGIRNWEKDHSHIYSNTIHWSIILHTNNHLNFNTILENDKNLDRLIKNNSDLFKRWERCGFFNLPTRIQQKLYKSSSDKFVFNVSNLKNLASVKCSRAIVSNYLKVSINEYEWSDNDFNKHILKIYKNIDLRLAPKIEKLHIFISGYGSSGKSTICDFLEKLSNAVKIIKRPTTRKFSPDFEELERYDPISESDFSNLISNESILAEHNLWGDLYGFYPLTIRNSEVGSILIYQVGWSKLAIKRLKEYLHKYFPTDPVLLFILEPKMDVLKDRLIEERQRNQDIIENDLIEAKLFYQNSKKLHDRAFTIDTSEKEEEAFYEILKQLQPYLSCFSKLSTEYEYDIFLSHSSDDKESIIIPLTNILQSQGIKIWLDKFKIRLGEDFFRSINSGLRNSKIVIPFISESFIKSEWANKELSAAFIQQMTSKTERVIPVVIGLTITEFQRYYPLLSPSNAIFFKDYKTDKLVDERDINNLASEINKILVRFSERLTMVCT